MPELVPTPAERHHTDTVSRSAPETIFDSVFEFGRGVKDAVFGRTLKQADIDALAVEARTNEHFARSIWWKGVRDQAVLVELAHIAAEHHPANLAGYFNRLGIRDERARVEIAKTVARKAAGAVGSFIDRFDIPNEKDRAEIALVIAAHSASAITENIAAFKIRSEQTRFEIALAAAKKSGEEFSRGLKNFGFADNRILFELAKVTVNHEVDLENGARKSAPYRSSRYIESFGLSPEQLVTVARLAAESSRGNLAEFIDRFGITDQPLLIELAKVSMERNTLMTLENLDRFGISDAAARVELAQIAVRRDTSSFIRYFESFKIQDPAVRAELALSCAQIWPTKVALAITKFGIEDPAALALLARMAMLNEPVQSLPHVLDSFGIPKEHLNAEIIDPGFARIGNSYASPDSRAGATYLFKMYTGSFRLLLTTPDELALHGLNPSEAMALEPHERMRAIVGYLQKHVPRFDTSLGSFLDEVQADEIIPAALAATLLTWNTCDLERYPNRGRAALAEVTGYDLPTGKLSPNGARELWGALLTAYDLLGGSPSVRLPVTFDDRPRAIRFITLGSSIIGLGGALPEYREPLSGKKLDDEIKRLETILEETFARQIGIDTLPQGSLEKLLSRWGGDVTPFSVLAARFRHNHGWERELPVLASIAATVLDGTFHDKRYARNDTQLECLNDRQLQAWRENPATLRLCTVPTNGSSAQTSLRDNVRAVFESNLLVHLPEAVAAHVAPAAPPAVSRFVALAERDRARERLTFADAVALLRTAIESSNEEELKQTVTAINGLKQTLLRSIAETDPDVARQLSDDLNTLKDLFRSRKGTEGQQYYVFSTITDDPKLLLMTGDLVQSASCQNYRSGFMVGTLPGYVIDGNIKLALSYVVKKQQFDKALAHLGLEPDSSCRVTFDAPRQTLRLAREDDPAGSAVELPLGYALRREVLRLGSHGRSGKPVLLTERPYLQPHPIDQQIARQQAELIAAARGAIGATTPSKLFTTTFPPSRNPGGVYSDECGGTKIGAYQYR